MTKLLPQLDTTSYTLQKNLAILKDQHILTNSNGKQEITVAGWLCFAKDPQKLRLFRNAYIELQVFHGSMRNIPLKKYDIKGSLPRQIEQTIQLLQQNIWLIPKIQGARREEIPAYDDNALREVVTNSLVHRDYKKMHQPVKVAIFDNRIEIENPGGLMPGLTIYNLIHKRDWRNPLLAEFMKKFGFGEMDGQGIDRLYTFTLALKVPPPTFINNDSSFTVILCSPKEFEQFTPNEKKFMVMILAVMHSQIDNEIIRDALGTNSEKAGTLIKAMVADKILQPSSSSRKYAKYTLTEQYREKFFC
jgi:predicted HTH transcriptional regulator